MRKPFALLIAAMLAVTPAFAELPFTGFTAKGPIAGTSSVLDDNVVFYVQYVGTASTKPTIEVEADGDIQFQVAGTNDALMGCPTQVTGIIDTQDADCNTMGEVVNAINRSTNWRAAIVAALYADSADNTIKILAETDTNLRIGAPIYFDNNNVDVAADQVTVLVAPPYAPADGSFFFLGPGAGLNVNPFARSTSFLSAVSEKKTSGGTIGATIVYGVSRIYAGASRALTEVSRVVWSQTGGATATQATLDFSNFPLVSLPGEAFIARVSSSTSITVQNVNAVGVFAQRP